MAMAIAAVIWSQLDGSATSAPAWPCGRSRAARCSALDPGFLGDRRRSRCSPGPTGREVTTAIDEALASAHQHGLALRRSRALHMWRAGAHLRRGELDEAERCCRRRRVSSSSGASAPAPALYLRRLPRDRPLERGELAAPGARSPRSPSIPTTPPTAPASATTRGSRWRRSKASAGAAAGDGRGARAPRHARVLNPADNPWRAYKIRALAKLDRREEALELAEEKLELARHWGAPGTSARCGPRRWPGSATRETLAHLERRSSCSTGSPRGSSRRRR